MTLLMASCNVSPISDNSTEVCVRSRHPQNGSAGIRRRSPAQSTVKPAHFVRDAERHRHGAPDSRRKLPSARDGRVLRNRACPLEDREPAPVTIGDVDEVGIRVLEHLPGLPVNVSVGCIFWGQVKSHLPW